MLISYSNQNFYQIGFLSINFPCKEEFENERYFVLTNLCLLPFSLLVLFYQPQLSYNDKVFFHEYSILQINLTKPNVDRTHLHLHPTHHS